MNPYYSFTTVLILQSCSIFATGAECEFKCKQAKTAYKQKEQELLAFKSVERWLSTIRNELTKNQYVKHLWRYCTATQMTPDQLEGTRSQNIRLAIAEYILRRRYDPEGKLVYELAQRARAK